MSSHTVEEAVTLRCCACSGKVTFEAPKADAASRPTFFHTMPYCERFDRTNTTEELLQYIRDCATTKN